MKRAGLKVGSRVELLALGKIRSLHGKPTTAPRELKYSKHTATEQEKAMGKLARLASWQARAPLSYSDRLQI